MGDEGKLYNGITPATIDNMRKMISVAHLIYPNYTEACYLTGTAYQPHGVTADEAHALIDKLRKICPKSVLITSVTIDGQPSVMGYNHDTQEYFCLPYTEIPIHFPGTGDIFSAVLIGYLLQEQSLKVSTRKAMDAVYKLIDLNKDNEDKNRGIPLEKFLAVVL